MTIDCYGDKTRNKNDLKSFPITIGAIDIGFESGVDQSSDCVGVET